MNSSATASQQPLTDAMERIQLQRSAEVYLTLMHRQYVYSNVSGIFPEATLPKGTRVDTLIPR